MITDHGKRLRALRGNRQREKVAGELGISSSALGMYESGSRVPRDAVKKRIAAYYGVSVQQLFFDEDAQWKNPAPGGREREKGERRMDERNHDTLWEREMESYSRVNHAAEKIAQIASSGGLTLAEFDAAEKSIKRELEEAMRETAKAAKGYSLFVQIYMAQQAKKPDGIEVSLGDFQDGFRALNHLAGAMERICRVLTQTEPGKEADQSFSHSDRSDGPSSEQSSHSKQPVE